MNPFLKLALLGWKNRLKASSLKSRLISVLLTVTLLAFSLALVLVGANARIERDFSNFASGLQMASLAVFLMLLMSNFACALAAFFGAQDVPLILALPVSRLRFMFGRGLVAIWNASWSTLFFIVPLLFGLLYGVNATLFQYLLAFLSLTILLLTTGLIGVLAAILFVNVVPMNRLLEFLGVVLAVIIMSIAWLTPEFPVGESYRGVRTLGMALLASESLDLLPSVAFAKGLSLIVRGEQAFDSLALLFGWFSLIALVTGGLFQTLFLRGWDSTFGAKRRERVVRSAKILLEIPFDRQLSAILNKERRMFFRDASQIVQLLVILLLTFLYLFNLKSLRMLSFAVEDGSHWWQGALGLANLAMGGCVAAAIATRFVFPSISLEGRAYALLRVTPLTISKFLLGKCLAWFLPVAAVTVTLLLAGAFALQLPEIAILHTLVVAIALAGGLVGLGVGLGALYAKFDWEHTSSLHSGFGNLLYMSLAFVLILATMLPSGFLFFTACVPSFAADLGGVASTLVITLTLFIVVGMNLLVARGAVCSGAQRLQELEQT